jgi:hypothetical protein
MNQHVVIGLGKKACFSFLAGEREKRVDSGIREGRNVEKTTAGGDASL